MNFEEGKQKIKETIDKMTESKEIALYSLLSELVSDLMGRTDDIEFLRLYNNNNHDLRIACGGDYKLLAKGIFESPCYSPEDVVFTVVNGTFVSLTNDEYDNMFLASRGLIVDLYMNIFGIDRLIKLMEQNINEKGSLLK